MINKLIKEQSYKDLVAKQAKELCEYLVSTGQEFAVTANIKGVRFDPELPKPITSKFAPFSLFVLANYSFESLKMTDFALEFEAGFGKENFGSVVRIPYNAIFQVVLDESILFVNPTATVNEYFEFVNHKEKSRSVFKKHNKNRGLVID